MNSTFRLLLAAMPDIATTCEKITDPQLRAMAFDTLVQAARDGGSDSYGGMPAEAPTYSGFTSAATLPASSYSDPSSTRVDNGSLRG